MRGAPVYLDASALAKLVLPELETVALSKFLEDRPVRLSSVIARVELLRAARRQGRPAVVLERAASVLDRVTLVDLDAAIITTAGSVEPPLLRTLDAVHLATALSLGDDLGGIVTYDRRLAEAARRAGLTVWSPR